MTRADLSVTFVTRRPVGETGVHRLLVRDDDRELALFVTPGVPPCHDCEPGDELALSDVRLLEADEPGEPGALQEAIAAVDPDAPVGIIDERTARADASTEGPIDAGGGG